MKLALNLLLLCALAGLNYAHEPHVWTSLGEIKGSLMYTRTNKTILAFRGVRYGKSTEGERRFKVAEPIEPWTGVLDASKEGPSCPLIAAPELASEDCLRLNVYAGRLPNGPSHEANPNRPVVVWFHPGGFYGFSAQSYVFGPEYFLDQDVVLVTVEYRMGTFGFMSTGDERAPGNIGLKDQVEALRFVQKHISAFGGNPNLVTIAGYSAGSWSCIYHMMSPMSKGLFHRVIASSGSPTTPDLVPTNQTDILLRQASFVDCPSNDVDAAIECLKKVPHQKISDTLPRFYEWYNDPTLIWSPVVEPDVAGVERFVVDQPLNLIRKGKFEHVPLITGITKDEFGGIALPWYEAALKGDESVYKNFTDNWEHAAPISFQYERNTEKSRRVSRALKKFYFNDEPITVKNGLQLNLIYTDAIIGWPTQRFAQLIAQYSKAPVYNYQYVYQGRYSFATWSDSKKPFGVVHHDDLLSFLTISFAFPLLTRADPEWTMVEKMTSMWAHFAKTGEPIPKKNHLFKGVVWQTLNPKEQNYLEIGETFKVKNRMFPERYALWDSLFPMPPLN